jgi:hypothetical protein
VKLNTAILGQIKSLRCYRVLLIRKKLKYLFVSYKTSKQRLYFTNQIVALVSAFGKYKLAANKKTTIQFLV